MACRSGRKHQRRGLLAAVIAALAWPGADAAGQHITVDGRLSPAQTLVGPNYAIGANLGQQKGGNLFQSFGLFGLTQGETATFSGPANVTNVIGRVTGGTVSSINGTVRSTIPGATVYLINPAGVVFGANAKVNVSGGFHASSADYIRMSDGSRFQATNPNASTLTAAPPAAFGFLSATPMAVTVNGATLGPVPGTLSLVGGPVTISGGTLSAPGGTVHIASAASPGEIPVNRGSGVKATVTSRGAVLVNNAQIVVSDPAGTGSGSVKLRGGTVTISAGTIDADNNSSSPGGTIVLGGDASVAVTNGSSVHAFANASGQGAGIVIWHRRGRPGAGGWCVDHQSGSPEHGKRRCAFGQHGITADTKRVADRDRDT